MNNETIPSFSNEETVERLTPELYESLAVLNDSPYWTPYRKLLLQAKQAYLDSVMSMRDPLDITKTLGLAAGINFAINQLPILVSAYRQKEQKVLKALEKKESLGKEFRRG